MAKIPFCPAGNSLLLPFVFARPHICELQECRIRQERQEHIPLDDLAMQGHQAMQVLFLSHLQNAHLNAILRCASTPHASSSPALPVPPPQAPMGAYGIIPPANGAALCYRIASPCFACSLYLQKRLCAVPG